MSTPEKQLLSFILVGEVTSQEMGRQVAKNIEFFITRNVGDCLVDPTSKRLAELAIGHYKKTKAHITKEDILYELQVNKSILPAEKAGILEYFSAACSGGKEFGAFILWYERCISVSLGKKLSEVLHTSAKMLTQEVVDQEDGVKQLGPIDTLDFTLRKLKSLKVEISTTDSEGGSLQENVPAILQNLDDIETGKMTSRLSTGITSLDLKLGGGLGYGWLFAVGAFVKQGKSHLCGNIGYNYAINGLQVLVLTTEMTVGDYYIRLLTRHARDDPRLGTRKIRHTDVTTASWKHPDDKDIFFDTSRDFQMNENYGNLAVYNAAGYTFEDIQAKVDAYESIYGKPLDVLVVDYLAMIGTTRKNMSTREEQVMSFREAKSLATSYNNGRGCIVITPHQLKQDDFAKVKAEAGRFFKSTAFSETSEVVKSCDVAMCILQTDDMKALKEVAWNITVFRHGHFSADDVMKMPEDYETCFIGD